jgi:hypothetical protein
MRVALFLTCVNDTLYKDLIIARIPGAAGVIDSDRAGVPGNITVRVVGMMLPDGEGFLAELAHKAEPATVGRRRRTVAERAVEQAVPITEVHG